MPTFETHSIRNRGFLSFRWYKSHDSSLNHAALKHISLFVQLIIILIIYTLSMMA